MVGGQTVFKYKTIKGILHKCPAMIKLFVLLTLSIICMSLPSLWLATGIMIAVFFAFLCRFTLREQLTDFKPAFFYTILMYSLSVFSNLINKDIIDITNSLFTVNYTLLTVLLPHHDYIRIVLRLTLIIQLSALFFRSTSSIELRECLNIIESLIRRIFSKVLLIGKYISLYPRFSDNITLFLSFIPEIFETWSKINQSWRARGGKQGLRKIKMLVFVLISLSFEKAAVKAKALEARNALIKRFIS